MRLIDSIIYLRMPWWCDCHEPDCEECATRYFNHKGYRCDSELMISSKLWNIFRRIKYRNAV